MKLQRIARMALISAGIALLGVGILILITDYAVDSRVGSLDSFIVIGAGAMLLVIGMVFHVVQERTERASIRIPKYEGEESDKKGIRHAYVDALNIVSMRSAIMADYDLDNDDQLKLAKTEADGLIESAQRVRSILDLKR